MNTLPLPTSTEFNTIMVAIVALTHIQIATYLTGSTTIVIASEIIGMVRPDPRHDRLAKGIVTSWAYLFGFGSAIAILFVMFVLSGLWGRFYLALLQITFPIFVFEAGAFVAEIVLLYSTYANWDRLSNHRLGRLGMLILLNIVFWWQMVFIDVVASFMLTPVRGNGDVLTQMLNPTNWPLTIHRTVGNIAWAGAAIAAFSAIRYLRVTRRRARAAASPASVGPDPATLPEGSVSAAVAETAASGRRAVVAPANEAAHAVPDDPQFWDWAGQWGLVWALLFTLFQPWIGYSYAKEIQLHAYEAWYKLMFGNFSNVFLAQIGLLGVIVVAATLYLWRRLRASGSPRNRRSGVAAILVAVVMLFAAQPAWFAGTYQDTVAAGLARPWWDGGLLNPLGNFIPFKVGCLGLMVLIAMYALTRYLQALSRQQLRWGDATRGSQALVIIVGVSVSVMMGLMGVIREGSRGDYLINGELTIHGQQPVPPTTQPQTGTR